MNVKAFVQDTVGRALTKYHETYPPGGSSGGGTWSVVTADTIILGTSNNPSSTTIDVSSYGFSDVNDYQVFVDVIDGSGGNYWNVSAYVSPDINRKKTTSFQILANKANAPEVTQVTVAYVIIAKGFGTGSRVFTAEYNVTTTQELLDYLGSEPFAPLVVKRGTDYYTALLFNQRDSESVLVRVMGTSGGDYYIYNYVVTGSTWAASSYGLQKRLVSGTDIKTINGQSLLGSGNIVAYDDTELRNRIAALEAKVS